VDVCVVDKSGMKEKGVRTIRGDASDPAVLAEAGFATAPAVIITTHDDDTNVYLSFYCKRLRPEVQIFSRANLDRNVRVLRAAGAEHVLSLASLAANRIINLLEPGRVIMLNEGVNIFRAPAGSRLAGRTLLECGIRPSTHCNVVAVKAEDGSMSVNPDPGRVFSESDELFLVGDFASELSYYRSFWPEREAAKA